MSIKFQPPTPETAGFLRRMKSAMYFSEKLKSGELSVELIDGLVDFLVGFVVEPIDKEEAKNLLFDASQEQFTNMLSSVMGGTEAVPNTKSEP